MRPSLPYRLCPLCQLLTFFCWFSGYSQKCYKRNPAEKENKNSSKCGLRANLINKEAIRLCFSLLESKIWIDFINGDMFAIWTTVAYSANKTTVSFAPVPEVSARDLKKRMQFSTQTALIWSTIIFQILFLPHFNILIKA